MARAISVVVPFYLKKAAWKKTFAELKLQLNPGDEVIVVNDHSPSGIGVCICKSLKMVSPPKLDTHIYRLNTLRNLGIREAKNDAVVVLDPDCIPNPNFLKNARTIFDPSVLFAGRIDHLAENGSIKRLDERKGSGSSRWLDKNIRGTSRVYGGVMFFSKSRAKLAGLFDTEYDSAKGAEDHDFSKRCYHSGMRIRYEPGLAVQHQFHPKIHLNQERNRTLLRTKSQTYRHEMHRTTPYKPAVGVLIATLQRPYYIDQVMRAVFRSRIPLKVCLVNQGDTSKEQLVALAPWRGRWAVDVIDNPEPKRLSEVRTEAMEAFRKEGYKYMITLDDDILPPPGSIEALINALTENPQYHAIAGGIIQKNMNRMLGGYITREDGKTQYRVLPLVNQTVEVHYISSGFTAFKLDPFIPYDTEYEFGWNDWDWSQELKKRGLRLAVCGDAIAPHKYLITAKGIKPCYDSVEYHRVRQNTDRHKRSADRFHSKWGFRPRDAKMWDKPAFQGTLPMKTLKPFKIPCVETVRVQNIESPIYSVVVPVGNLHGARVRNCLRSLQLQTLENIEVIVVDYGSTPKNHKLLVETLKPFDCTVLRFPTRDAWSMSLSRNIGLRRARGKYVVTLDADCVLTPEVLNCVLNFHKERSLSRLIVMAPYFLDEGVEIENMELPRDYAKLREGKSKYLTNSVGGFMSAPRSWWQKVRGFDERMKMYGGEDGDLYRRAEIDPNIESYKVTENYAPNVRFYHQWHRPMRLYQSIGMEVVQRQYKINQEIKKGEYSIRRNAPDWGHDDATSAVAVSVLTMKRPRFLSQCLMSIARTEIPIKLFIVNQNDESEEQMNVLKEWRARPYVNYILNKPAKWPGAARGAVFTMAHDMGYEYIVTVDDDCCLLPGAIESLVKAADAHPEFHSISGYLIDKRRRYMLGGKKTPTKNGVTYKNYDWMKGIHETDYVSNGFRLIRLEPLVIPDPKYEVGLTDWDYANKLEARGLRMAVCGEAGAYHKLMMVGGQMTWVRNPPGYKRGAAGMTERMNEYFKTKWGYKVK